jgi:hypothetical protein
MTVAELVSYLQSLPPDLTLVVNGPEHESGGTCVQELTRPVPVWLGDEVSWHAGGKTWCFEHERKVRGPESFDTKALLLL